MRRSLLLAITLAACSAACEHAGQSHPPTPSDTPGSKVVVDSGRIAPATTQASNPSSPATASAPTNATAHASTVRGLDPNTPIIRALYVNRFAAQSRKRMHQLIAMADSTDINGLVLDMKDE